MQTKYLKTLAKGYSKFSDLLSQSHVSSSPTFVDVLEKLIQMEVVKKKHQLMMKIIREKQDIILQITYLCFIIVIFLDIYLKCRF